MIGPRTSTSVHVTNTVFAGLHIPQLAPVATDPTLVPYEYPFLARVSSMFYVPCLLSNLIIDYKVLMYHSHSKAFCLKHICYL